MFHWTSLIVVVNAGIIMLEVGNETIKDGKVKLETFW